MLNRLMQALHARKEARLQAKLAIDGMKWGKTVDIIAGKHGALTATVTLTTTVNDKVSNARALYEYRLGSPSGKPEGWHCYNDWND
jgi:hypothetical protein